MTTPQPTPQEMLYSQLRQLMASQPWWKRYSNTVTTIIAGAAVLAWWITSTGMDLPAPVTYGIGALFFVANVLGIKYTPNGVTPSLVHLLTTRLSNVLGTHIQPGSSK